MTRDNKLKTGTTCIGMLFKDGVLMAADNRVTSYKINAENFTKIFDLSNNVVSTVSGGVADAQRFVRVIKGELKLISLKNERDVFVREAAMTLTDFQYSGMRANGAVVGMLLGGYDVKDGVSLYELSPEGSILDTQPYVTSGSGSIFVDGILGSEYTSNLSQKDALVLVEKCFKSAFKHDNASGGGFIVKTITKDGICEIERKVVKTQFVKE